MGRFGKLLSLVAVVCTAVAGNAQAADAIKALILDGQNNHNWKQTTPLLTAALEGSKLFTVDVATSPPKDTKGFAPEFSKYQVVVSNYNGARWPKETEAAFIDYVKNGGGFVVVHAADNAFGDWKEYNEMIGLGGWGERTEKHGPYVYYKDDKLVRDDSRGNGGSHGAQHAFQIIVRDAEHPITKGMPSSWMHAQDELYDRLRGPATNMHVLATAHADTAKGGTGRHEPMMMTIDYGKGRVFHTPMGHADYSIKCTGFIVTLQRGSEWAATGKVTQSLPEDFPTRDKTATRELGNK